MTTSRSTVVNMNPLPLPSQWKGVVMGQEPWGVYVRISQARRKDKDGKTYIETLGIERQEPPCRELVARKGGKVFEVYTDNDKSGFKGERPDFERMLIDAKEGRTRGIVVWDADRLSRDPDRDNGRIIELAEKHGIKLGTVTGEYDLATSNGKMMFRIAGALARRESEHKSERLMLRHDQKAAAGEHHGGGVRPFGYEDDFVTVREDEANLIREAATRILDHQEHVAVVLHDWHRRGIVTTRGNPFKTGPLKRMLRSPRIAGLRQHRGEVVGPAEWPAIIDMTTRNRLLAFYGARKGAAGKKVGRPPMKLYAGLLVCGRCLGKMFPFNKGNAVQVYFCPKGTDHSGCALQVNAPDLERVMEAKFFEWVTGPHFAAALQRRMAAQLSDDPTPERIEADREELSELGAILGTRFAEPQHFVRHAELEAGIQYYEERLASQPETTTLLTIPRASDELSRAWASWSTPERQRVLRAVLIHVLVMPGVPGHFRESRIVPIWRDGTPTGKKEELEPLSKLLGRKVEVSKTRPSDASLDRIAKEVM